jgi:hypothetical protein
MCCNLLIREELQHKYYAVFQHGLALFPCDWCLVLRGNWQWFYSWSCYRHTNVAKCRGFEYGLTDKKYLWLVNFWRLWNQNSRKFANLSEVLYRRASYFHNNFWSTVNICIIFIAHIGVDKLWWYSLAKGFQIVFVADNYCLVWHILALFVKLFGLYWCSRWIYEGRLKSFASSWIKNEGRKIFKWSKKNKCTFNVYLQLCIITFPHNLLQLQYIFAHIQQFFGSRS